MHNNWNFLFSSKCFDVFPYTFFFSLNSTGLLVQSAFHRSQKQVANNFLEGLRHPEYTQFSFFAKINKRVKSLCQSLWMMALFNCPKIIRILFFPIVDTKISTSSLAFSPAVVLCSSYKGCCWCCCCWFFFRSSNENFCTHTSMSSTIDTNTQHTEHPYGMNAR